MVWTIESPVLSGSRLVDRGSRVMQEAPHEYWARRASEEARLALRSGNSSSANAHRELARAYRERARLLAEGLDGPPQPRVASAR